MSKNKIRRLCSLLVLLTFVGHFSSVWGEEEKLDQTTPRKMWKSFRRLCYDYDYEAVQRLMGVRKEGEEDKRAERLCGVTDLLKVDSEKLSDDPEGMQKTDDVETIAKINGPSGEETLRLKKKTVGNAKMWFFHPQVAGAVQGWYQHLEGQHLRDQLPLSLQIKGPLGLKRWQWLGLPLLFFTSYLFAFLIVFLMSSVVWLAYRKARPHWAEGTGKKTKRALRGLVAPLVFYGTLHGLFMPYEVESWIRRFTVVLIVWAAVGVLWQLLKMVHAGLQRSTWIKAHPSGFHLLPLGHRVGRFLLLSFGLGLTLYSMGYSVLSLVAGLGLGGVAVALAAQKTIEQFFGGIVLSVDQPMRIGDLVKIGDIHGHVEYIGLRSTRIRTLDRSLITIPNGKLADMNIETMAARDRIRLNQVLKIDQSLSADKLKKLIDGLTHLLENHPQAWPEDIQVALRGFSDAAFEVEISCWFRTTSSREFADIRQEVLLDVTRLIEQGGGSLVVQTRMLQTEKIK